MLNKSLLSFFFRIVTAQQPLELTVNAPRREGKAGEIMLVRQNAVAEAPVNLKRTVAVVRTESTPQSVREVLINSFSEQQQPEQQPSNKSNNVSHLEDIAGNLEASGGLPFHPQNPEGSMIKELLLKTRLNGLVPVMPSSSALSVSVSGASAPTVPSPRRITAQGANEERTHIYYLLKDVLLYPYIYRSLQPSGVLEQLSIG